MKTGARVIGELLLVVSAVLGWWQFAKSEHPPNAGHGSAVTGMAKVPKDVRANRPQQKTSGRAAGLDSVARYFRADEAGRRAIIEELGDREGKGSSPDDAVERLAVLHAKESDPAKSSTRWRGSLPGRRSTRSSASCGTRPMTNSGSLPLPLSSW